MANQCCRFVWGVSSSAGDAPCWKALDDYEGCVRVTRRLQEAGFSVPQRQSSRLCGLAVKSLELILEGTRNAQ